MQSENKAKVLALKSIMNNPKLSKILEDGFNSPVGSTKREQAKSVVSILKKLGSTSTPSPADNLREQSKKLEKMKDPYAKIYSRAFDGKGGPDGSYDTANTGPRILKRAPMPTWAQSPYSVTPQIGNINTPGPEEPMGTALQWWKKFTTVPNVAPTFQIQSSDNGNIPYKGLLESNRPFQPTIGSSAGNFSADEMKKINEYNAYLRNYNKRKTWGGIFKTPTLSAGEKKKKPSDFGLSPEFDAAEMAGKSLYSVDRQRATKNLPKSSAFSNLGTSSASGVVPSAENVVDLGQDLTGLDLGNALLTLPKGKVIHYGKTWRYKNNKGVFETGTEQQMKARQVEENPSLASTPGAPEAPTSTTDAPGTIKISGDSYTYVNRDGTVHVGKLGDNYVDETVSPTGDTSKAGVSSDQTTYTATNPFAGTEYEETWNNIPEDVRSGYTPLFKAVQAGLGPDQFALMTMADKEKLKAMFPGVPEEMLPTGASLQSQVDELANRLREEYKLDQIANERNELIRSGATLSTDLTDYMRGRDTYIQSVNGMIDRVKANINGAGLTDPASQAANNQYLDYLSVLKGRQNKRYIELLNSSITRHDSMMENLTNEYNTRFQNYKDELTSESAMTKQRYDEIYNALSAMYNNIEAAPTVALDKAYKEAQVYKTYADGIKDATGSSSAGGTDYLKEAETLQDNFMDKANNYSTFSPTLNLYNEVSAALGSGKSINALSYLIQKGLNNTYGGSLADVEKGKAMIKAFKDAGGDELMASYGYVDSSGNPLSFSDDMAAALEKPISNAISSQISSNSDSIKSALDWITDLDVEDLDKKKNKFFSKFDNIDSNLLNAIWNYYSARAKDATNQNLFKNKAGRKTVFKILDKNEPISSASSALASQLASYLSTQ